MTRALVASPVLGKPPAKKSDPPSEKVPTSVVVLHTSAVKAVESTAPVLEPSAESDSDDPGDGAPTTVAKKRKKKKGKGAQAESERRRDFARVDKEKDRPALAGAWGYGPGRRTGRGRPGQPEVVRLPLGPDRWTSASWSRPTTCGPAPR